MRDVWKLLLLCGLMAPPACTSPPEVREPIDVGSRRQLLLDDAWFDHSDNVELSLHQPTPAETVIQCDRPWEGKSLHYTTVVDDGGTFRMWYRVALGDPRVDSGDDTVLTCYAESRDGIDWEKPSLGRYEFEGSKDNNILGPPEDFTNISVLLDPNQEAGSGTRYKMISRVDGISGFASPDGIRWAPVATNPLLSNGPFDSHNILLWDDERERYVIYLRGVDPSVPGPFKGGRRAIRRSESSDFLSLDRTETGLHRRRAGPSGLPPLHQRRRQVFPGRFRLLHVSHDPVHRPFLPGDALPWPVRRAVRLQPGRPPMGEELPGALLSPGTGRAQLAGPQSHRGTGRDPDRAPESSRSITRISSGNGKAGFGAAHFAPTASFRWTAPTKAGENSPPGRFSSRERNWS